MQRTALLTPTLPLPHATAIESPSPSMATMLRPTKGRWSLTYRRSESRRSFLWRLVRASCVVGGTPSTTPSRSSNAAERTAVGPTTTSTTSTTLSVRSNSSFLAQFCNFGLGFEFLVCSMFFRVPVFLVSCVWGRMCSICQFGDFSAGLIV